MRIIHFECGLGNQMLDYCDYLAAQKSNPKTQCFGETILFDIPECQEVISAWNGFELGTLFGLQIPNVREQFTNAQWASIIQDVKDSEFWNHGWSYPEAIVKAFANQGLILENKCNSLFHDTRFRHMFDFMKNTRLWSELLIMKTDLTYRPTPDQLFYVSDKDVYAGHTVQFMYKGNNIEEIEPEIRRAFVFPTVTDEKNKSAIDEMRSCNSIGVHIRRDDAMIGVNRSVFYTGYYRRAVKLIKSKVACPVFYIFGTPKTVRWVKENLFEIGLDSTKDSVRYVDWNSGENSFRDMQLLSMCKHNIISLTSFGWWGTFLNTNPNKITISPLKKINTTHHV